LLVLTISGSRRGVHEAAICWSAQVRRPKRTALVVGNGAPDLTLTAEYVVWLRLHPRRRFRATSIITLPATELSDMNAG
jgi:hypothetical protein